MKQLTTGFALDGSCPQVAMGPLESLPKIGINNVVIYNVFQKSYNVVNFVNQLKQIINGPNGKINVMLSLDSAPYSEMTEAKIMSLDLKFRGDCQYVNRFPPGNIITFGDMVDGLILAINQAGLMSNISWQLWQEPNSRRYFHGTFQEFISWTYVKYNLLNATHRPIYIGDFTTSLIMNCDLAGQRFWIDWIESDSIYNDPLVRFSSSFYWHTATGSFDFTKNTYPKRSLPHSAITAYSLGTISTSAQIHSSAWMIGAVKLLQNIYSTDIDTVYFWNLLDCNDQDGSKGKFSAWSKSPNGGPYKAKPLWNMIIQLMEVIKNGYEPIEGGIRGLSKSIIVTGNNYSIINN